MGQVKASVDAGLPSGKIVAELDQVSFAYDNKTIVNSFSATLLRGDKVGLIGPNGSGKTTSIAAPLGLWHAVAFKDSLTIITAGVYRQVKERIARSLAAGEWKPGERLQSETQLAQRFGVAIVTLRAGISELVAAGTGASSHSDGVDCLQTDGSNSMNQPIEALCLDAPIRIRRFGLRADSGGAGAAQA